jgi:hypothetical protein
MKLLSRLVVGTALAISVLSQSPAFAVDSSIVGGAACYARRYAQGGYLTLGMAGTGNNVGSNANPAVDVVCPLKRDNTSNSATSITSAKVRVVRGADSPAVPLTCTLSSRTYNGTVLASHIQSTLALGETILTLNVNSSVPGGYYIVHCSLPWQNAVQSIRLDEP